MDQVDLCTQLVRLYLSLGIFNRFFSQVALGNEHPVNVFCLAQFERILTNEGTVRVLINLRHQTGLRTRGIDILALPEKRRRRIHLLDRDAAINFR